MKKPVVVNGVRVDARYAKAQEIVASGRHLLRGQLDAYLYLIYSILRACKAARSGDGAVSTDSDMRRALRIHTDGGSLMYKLQAFLLTQLSFAEIASRLSLPVGVVELYEAVFFDVRQALEANRAATLDEILGQYRDDAEFVEGYVWKLSASSSVEELETAMAEENGGRLGQEALAAKAQRAKTNSLVQLEKAVRDVNHAAPDAIRQIEKINQGIEAAQPEDHPNQINQAIDAVFKALPLRVATDPKGGHPGLKPYDDSAIELAADEVLHVGMGGQLDNEKELLHTKFPEPTTSDSSPTPDATVQHLPSCNEQSPPGPTDLAAHLPAARRPRPTKEESMWQQVEEKKNRNIQNEMARRTMHRATRTDHSVNNEVAPGVTNAMVDRSYDERAAHIVPFDVTAETKLTNLIRVTYPKWYPYEMRKVMGLTHPKLPKPKRGGK